MILTAQPLIVDRPVRMYLCQKKLQAEACTMNYHILKSENWLSLKTDYLRSYLKVFTGIKKKKPPKKIFSVGENLSFGLFDFLETHFTITFHDLSHF